MSKKCIICGDEVTEEPDYVVLRCKVCQGGPCVLFVPYADFLPDVCPFHGTNNSLNELRGYVSDIMDAISRKKPDSYRADSDYLMCQNIFSTIVGHILQSGKRPKWECIKGEVTEQ